MECQTEGMTMRKFAVIVLGAVMCVLGARSASAVVTLGFEINSISDRPLFLYQTNGTDSVTDDTLIAENNVDFTVTVEGSPVPTFDGAIFEMSADLVNLERVGPFYVLTFDGSFSARDGASGDSIIAAEFSGAQMLLMVGMGGGISFGQNLSLTTVAPPSLYTAGPELLPFLPAGLDLGGSQSMNFTVELLANVGDGPIVISGTSLQDGEIGDDFTFDSSFSGMSELVPEPTTTALLIAGLAAMSRRRRIA